MCICVYPGPRTCTRLFDKNINRIFAFYYFAIATTLIDENILNCDFNLTAATAAIAAATNCVSLSLCVWVCVCIAYTPHKPGGRRNALKAQRQTTAASCVSLKLEFMCGNETFLQQFFVQLAAATNVNSRRSNCKTLAHKS